MICDSCDAIVKERDLRLSVVGGTTQMVCYRCFRERWAHTVRMWER